MTTAETVWNAGLVLMVLALAVMSYLIGGGRRLVGPRRGEPFCGHPFEQTWRMDPRPTRWRCPKCRTWFHVATRPDGARHWTMER